MKRIIYTIIILLILTLNLRAQKEFGHVIPTTAEFIRYGEVPVSLFNGKLNYEVPIYRIQDRDFDIPISLMYTSDGFKPAKRPGLVGIDWFLNVGGVISREVYGSPDENIPNATEGQEWGFLMTVEKGKYDKDKIWNFDPEVILTDDQNLSSKYLKPIEGYYCDYSPDLFMFNFNGHNGQFMIDNQGVPKTNIKGYRVDLSNMAPQQRYEMILPNQSTIEIYTPNGYKYIFGGDLSALEFSINFTQGILPIHGKTNPTILAWHLTKIIAPNGRKVEFKYKAAMLSNSNINNTDPIWSSSKTSTAIYPTGSAIKNVVLESITVDNTIINFNSSVESTFLNTTPAGQFNTGYSDFNYAGYQLDSINITIGNEPLYSYKLGYTNNSKRRFLSTFIQPDGGIYSFTYNHPVSGYPEPDVVGVTDTWGYWKTINNTSPTHPKDTMILQMAPTFPPLEEDTTATQTTVEEPYSLLEKVSYPTGGFSTFTYEPNQYRYRIDQMLTNTFITKSLVTDTIPVGGFRIKKIEHYSSSNKKETGKNYFYTDDMTSTSSSTGILYQYPPYYILSSSGAKVFISGWKENYNINEPHIGYSKVYEQNMNNSYTKYTFSDYTNSPDIDNSKVVTPNGFDPDLLAATGVNRSTSYSQRRGLLLEKTIVDSTGVKVSKERCLYKNTGTSSSDPITTTEYEQEQNYINQPIVDYIVSFRSITGGGLANKIFIQNYPLISNENKINNVVRKTLYSYNDNDLISCTKELDSHGDTIKIVYNYLQNFSFESIIPDDLGIQNFRNYKQEEKQYKNNQLINTQKYIYKTNTSFPLVDSVKTYIGSNLLNPNVTNYNIYDNFGNPVYITKDESAKTVYIWSYKGLYPVAKIEGLTYSEVNTAVGSNVISNLAQNALPTRDDIEDIRTKLNNSGKAAFVSTYTYKPLVGITSATDARGVTIDYTYDSFGRLICTKKDGKIIQNFSYHYKP